MRTLIKNGTIVTAIDEFVGDVLVEGEKIIAVGAQLDTTAEEIVDAKGKYVLPGGVDQHVHYSFEFKGERVRGFETSNAAVAGGTTTVVEFVNQEQGKGMADTIFDMDKNEVSHKAMADYSYHAVVCDPVDKTFEEIADLPRRGISTVKLFMAYKGMPFHSDDEALYKALKAAKEAGVTVMVHCENADVIDHLQRKLVSEGKTDPSYHAVSRPARVELEATQRVINLAAMVEAPVYIVHVTAKNVMEAIRTAKNEGLPVYGETCVQYLMLDEDDLAKPNFEGAKYVMSPALRTKADQEALWEAVDNGWLNAISTDHCGFDWESQKHMGVDDFTNIPNGAPGVENRLAILWTYGVNAGKISRQRFVDLFATTPAKNMGIDHCKGHIGVGMDADIVLYDPNGSSIISNENSLHGVDYNTFEGYKQEGKVDKVFLRGKLVVDDGEFIGEKGDGNFIPGKPYGLCFNETKPTKKLDNSRI
ncbi:dihydropyrimidinase [Virgibacillus halotolerans]|uniref:dihydropyrimidinase n=1 Tax=Virgibacillus halotolerans TaxID=1071053 RepID=UPI001960B8E6|nr:dihydropyrimidinase [Virgibacillus halotolerans]MBM7600661.1 dihydropyrimidinase [Virgibacillus halotolerans]